MNAFHVSVVHQPVTSHHVGKHLLHSFGKYGFLLSQQRVYQPGIFLKGLLAKVLPLSGQEVVIKNIDDHSGVMSVFNPKSVFASFHYRVMVSEFIDRAVQFDAPGNAGPKSFPQVPAFYKITDEIAHHNVRIVAGKV